MIVCISSIPSKFVFFHFYSKYLQEMCDPFYSHYLVNKSLFSVLSAWFPNNQLTLTNLLYIINMRIYIFRFRIFAFICTMLPPIPAPNTQQEWYLVRHWLQRNIDSWSIYCLFNSFIQFNFISQAIINRYFVLLFYSFHLILFLYNLCSFCKKNKKQPNNKSII